MKRLCVLGPLGRMGQIVCRLAANSSQLRLARAVERPGHQAVGSRLAEVEVTDDLAAGLAQSDVYIDFTAPLSTAHAAYIATSSKTAAVIGTTGLTPQDHTVIDELAKVAPVVVAANFSLGVNILCILAEKAARALGEGYDLEVVEMHHRDKRDAPSGTALALGEALARGRDWQWPAVQRLSRTEDAGPRPRQEIGFASLRGGSIIGEHTALLLGENERLELTHRAQNREIFASGALRAAEWVLSAAPGRYGIGDVLGL